MNVRVPAIRRHKQGYYFVRWGGKDHHLSRDKSEAQRKYLEELKAWATWRENRPQRDAAKEIRQARGEVVFVSQVFERFLDAKLAENGPDLKAYYTKHIRRFARAYGNIPIRAIRPVHIEGIKDDMIREGYAPKTIRHDLTAIGTMLTWAATHEHCDFINLRGIRKPSLGPPPDKSLPFSTVEKMMRESCAKVRPWLALNYLCLMRPSEVIRVVHKQGEWTQENVYRIKGKTDHRSTWPRHVVFSESAKHWLSLAQPVWTRLDSYSSAVRRACEYGPGRLRHSAATHLSVRGVDRATVDLLLGHSPSRVSLTYAPIDFAPLLRAASLLAL